ncbi:hypothetical protein HDV00_009204 [Rhizophlyctis rosea]|nr:hypothetical protein HDV00_009204 [Rhizophlyctis rosea]
MSSRDYYDKDRGGGRRPYRDLDDPREHDDRGEADETMTVVAEITETEITTIEGVEGGTRGIGIMLIAGLVMEVVTGTTDVAGGMIDEIVIAVTASRSAEPGEAVEGQAQEMGEMDEEAAMQALMGFGGFDSTKGKKVAGTDVSAVAVNKQRTYRQYMNRRRGFNRNLSPTR